MSRFIRLKEEKIKNRIKSISFVLALTLLIQSVQGLGTYALFTDTEDITSNLAISTGDVDVELNEDFHQDTLSEGEVYKQLFNITNTGTLRQNINLSLKTGEEVELSKYIESYHITFGEGENVAPTGNLCIGEESLKKRENEEELFILDPGETITANIIVKTKGTTQNNRSMDLDLNLNIEAIQLDDNDIIDKGFYDIEVRTDRLKLSPIINNQPNGEIVFKDSGKKEDIYIYYEGYIAKPSEIKKVESLGNGILNNRSTTIKYGVDKNGRSYINLIADIYDFEWKGITTKFEDNYVTFEFIYKDNTGQVVDIKRFKFSFRYTGEQRDKILEGKIEEIDVQSEVEVVEPSTEEIEISSEEVVVELSTDEIKVPSEVEVVEPSTEEIEAPSEEVVEPSTEEIKVPSEVVQPTTEEIEAPSEIEVVLPSKEETEIEE